MLSKYLVKSSTLSALYSTGVSARIPSKSFISSLFTPKRQIDLNKCRFEIAKRADINPTVQFIESNFFKSDPLCKSLHVGKKKLEGPTENLIRDCIKQGMTIVAREKADDSAIIGVSMNTRSCPWDADRLEEYARLLTDVNMRKVMHIWALMAREPRLHKELSELSIFELGIIAVDGGRMGQGLGTELARRSIDLGRDLNFKYARMNCTSEFSIKIGEKLNMTRIWDVPFKNILMPDGKTPLAVPEIPHVFAAVYYMNLKLEAPAERH
jgi:hypothetical protein